MQKTSLAGQPEQLAAGLASARKFRLSRLCLAQSIATFRIRWPVDVALDATGRQFGRHRASSHKPTLLPKAQDLGDSCSFYYKRSLENTNTVPCILKPSPGSALSQWWYLVFARQSSELSQRRAKRLIPKRRPSLQQKGSPRASLTLPGKPVACNYGLLWLIYGLRWGIVACYFGLLGFSGSVAAGDLNEAV